MSTYLLLIEDDLHYQKIAREQLSGDYEIDICATAKEGLHKATQIPYDSFLLDNSLPDMCTLELIRLLRQLHSIAPIFMLSQIDTVELRIEAFESGLTGFLPKPYNCEELKARIRAAMRYVQIIPQKIFYEVNLQLDPLTRTVIRDGCEIILRKKEFDILQYMMRQSGKVVTRDMLIDQLWGNEIDHCSNMVDVHFNYLRKKIDKPFPNKILHTVHGIGYMLRAKAASELS